VDGGEERNTARGAVGAEEEHLGWSLPVPGAKGIECWGRFAVPGDGHGPEQLDGNRDS
jgi:hypothetical protein